MPSGGLTSLRDRMSGGEREERGEGGEVRGEEVSQPMNNHYTTESSREAGQNDG